VPGRPGEPGVQGPPGEQGSPGELEEEGAGELEEEGVASARPVPKSPSKKMPLKISGPVHVPVHVTPVTYSGSAPDKKRHYLTPQNSKTPPPPKKIHSSPSPVEVEDTCSPKPADEYARHVKEAAAEITKAYPDWARSTGGALEPWGQSGEWTHYRGPPYVKKLTLWKGAGVEQVKEGSLWRRVLGLNTAAGRKCDLRSCDHAMTGNSYLSSFDGLIVFSLAQHTLFSSLVNPHAFWCERGMHGQCLIYECSVCCSLLEAYKVT
jgi:hypothetical protein